MRTRDLKPGFFKNEVLGKLDMRARLLYAGLWCLADREGRCEDRPEKIRAELFPYERVELDKYLVILSDNGFIKRYCVEGERYIWLPKFKANQHPHPHEAGSVLPPYVMTSSDMTSNVGLGLLASSTLASVPSRDLERDAPEEGLLPFEPPRGRARGVTEEDLVSLEAQFPTVTVREQWEAAQDWLTANGKTKKDYVAFLRGWCRREANNHGRLQTTGRHTVGAGTRSAGADPDTLVAGWDAYARGE